MKPFYFYGQKFVSPAMLEQCKFMNTACQNILSFFLKALFEPFCYAQWELSAVQCSSMDKNVDHCSAVECTAAPPPA